MKRKAIALLLIAGYGCTQLSGQPKTIQERLGYPKNTKLLIIHGDDLGVAHSQNIASFTAMQAGMVNSGSIMVPCPWFTEVADYCKKNPGADIGLHLTLTSEWNLYKWGPVTASSKVPGLVNGNGFFYSSVDSVAMYAKPSEVEEELRNQVKRAIQAGIDPTHLDAHMGAVFTNGEFLKAYRKIGKEFNLPVMLGRGAEAVAGDSLCGGPVVLVDNIISASSGDYDKGMQQYYQSVLKNIGPGLNCLLIHLAYDNDEMKGVTVGHPYWGAAWRQQDFNFFTSEECRRLLKQYNIQLVTWREIRDKLYRR